MSRYDVMPEVIRATDFHDERCLCGGGWYPYTRLLRVKPRDGVDAR